MESALESLALPLDALRRGFFRTALRFNSLRRILTSRDRRIILVATFGIVITFGLCAFFPMVLFAVSPAILGVPHVASDIRYLVLRQELPRWWLALLGLGCGSILLLRLVDQFLPGLPTAPAEFVVAGGLTLAAAAAGRRQLFSLRFAIVAVAVSALYGLAMRDPDQARVLFAHLHNVVAILIWTVLFRRTTRAAFLPISVAAIGTTLLFLGVTLGPTVDAGGEMAFGLGLDEVALWLAPDWEWLTPDLSIGLALTYIFLQSIHYAVWLGWIPQENIRGEGTLSFRMTVRSLRRDFSGIGLIVIGVGMIGVAGFSFVDVHATRNTYLSIAVFHGYLEVAMLAYLFVRK